MNLARIRTPEYALFYCRIGNGRDIHVGRDYVIEFDYGIDYSEMIEFGELQKKNTTLRIPGFRLVRPVNDHDLENIRQNLEIAKEVRSEINNMLSNSHVQAKIVHVRMSLDQRRIFIRYFAKSPMNLQKFCKPLEQNYHATVNLWQVGVRDETRLIGCIGHCGREACCCSWMKHECAVNLKMAKSQGIPLNPASLNGTCNRLKCCLRYENSVYEEAGAKLPGIGSSVRCASHDNFEGIIINRDILRARLVLRSRQGKFLTVDAADVTVKDVTGKKNSK